MQEYSTSSVKEFISLQPGTSSMVPTIEIITPIENCSEKTNQRDVYDAMDTEEEDTTRTPKKQKVEEVGQLVQITEVKGKNKNQMKVKGPAFEVKEYVFSSSETPTNFTSQFNNRFELFDKYKHDKEVA